VTKIKGNVVLGGGGGGGENRLLMNKPEERNHLEHLDIEEV